MNGNLDQVVTRALATPLRQNQTVCRLLDQQGEDEDGEIIEKDETPPDTGSEALKDFAPQPALREEASDQAVKAPRLQCQDQGFAEGPCRRYAEAIGNQGAAETFGNKLQVWGNAVGIISLNLEKLGMAPPKGYPTDAKIGEFLIFRWKKLLKATCHLISCSTMAGGENLQLRIWKTVIVWVQSLSKGTIATPGVPLPRHLFAIASRITDLFAGNVSAMQHIIMNLDQENSAYLCSALSELILCFSRGDKMRNHRLDLHVLETKQRCKRRRQGADQDFAP